MNRPNNARGIILIKQLSSSILLSFSLLAFGQESKLEEKIKKVQQLMQSVEANKLTYNQELKTVSPGYFDYTVTEVNEKGQEKQVVYSFGLSDINTKSVRLFTKKDIILIELVVNGKQKLIKKTTDDGAKIAYVADFAMYGLNSDNGRNLERAIESAIPDAIALDKEAMALNTYNDYLKWLETNVSDVVLSKDRITQNIKIDVAKPTFIVLEQIRGSKQKRYEFNISLLNPNSVQYEISGDEFAIEVGTKNDIDAIKYLENGTLQGFTDGVTLYANSLSNGKDIHRVLKGMVPLSKKEFEASKPTIDSEPKAIQYLNNHMGNVISDERSTSQTIKLNDKMASIIIKETVDGKDNEQGYIFNLTDISTTGMSFKSKRTRLFLELETKKARPYIGRTENGQPQNYEKNLSLYFGSMDDAIIGKEALEFLIGNSQNSTDGDGKVPILIADAVGQLKNLIGTLSYGDDQVEQDIELLETETSTLKFTRTETNPKKSSEIVLEFSVLDLNKNGIKVEVSGKRVWAELVAKSTEKVVKVYENGEVQNYRNHLEIEATDIENAKRIVHIFERMAESQNK